MELLTTGPAPLGIDPDDVHAAYAARGFAQCSDEQLFEIAAPYDLACRRQDPANSFILHAPLELLARRALLRLVPPDQPRRGSRADALGRRDLRTGGRIDRARARRRVRVAAAAACEQLIDAIDRKDLDDDRRRRVAGSASTRRPTR